MTSVDKRPHDLLHRYRMLWFESTAGAIAPDKAVAKCPGLSRFSPVPRATLLIAIGLGHILGIDDDDLADESMLTTEEVARVLTDWWRLGLSEPISSTALPYALQSLLWACCDVDDPDAATVARSVQSSQLWERLKRLMPEVTEPPRDYRGALEEVATRRPELVFGAANHEEVINLLLDSCTASEVGLVLTGLEVLYTVYSQHTTPSIAALERSSDEIHYTLLEKGSWPSYAGAKVPSWVRDTVANIGARQYYASTGHVPAVFIVAESAEELRAWEGWTYSPRFGTVPAQVDRYELLLVPEFDDGPGYVTFRYSYSSYSTLQEVQVLFAVGLLRIEMYRFTPGGELEHCWNFGLPLPQAVIEDGAPQVFAEGRDLPDRFDFGWSEEEHLARLAMIEASLFEAVLVPRSRRAEAPSLQAAWDRRLLVVDRAAKDWAVGATPDHALLEESHEELSREVSKTIREPGAIDLDLLGPNRALLQFHVRLGSWPHLRCDGAYKDDEGNLRAVSLEFSTSIELGRSFTDVGQLSKYLSDGLAELAELPAAGVTKAVLSCGAGVYNAPFHDALLSLGFDEVSYTHRVATLEPRGASDVSGSWIQGYTDIGSEYLPAVTDEVALVSKLLGEQSPRSAVWPRYVHLAGHGTAGAREYEVSLKLGADRDAILTSAGILLEVDARSCDVAYLSACDTGGGQFELGQRIGAVPLDVAAIESGARTAISTCAPVNDFIACLFAGVFHAQLKNGFSVWNSYQTARTILGGGVAKVPLDMAELFDREIHSWRDRWVKAKAAKEDWRLFRLSGRHWA